MNQNNNIIQCPFCMSAFAFTDEAFDIREWLDQVHDVAMCEAIHSKGDTEVIYRAN